VHGNVDQFYISSSKFVTHVTPHKSISHSQRAQLATLSLSNEIRVPFEKFVDSPYYSESELYGGAVTVSFSKYLPWQAMHFLERSIHFSKTQTE
jgi:hypothetical protein